MEEKKLTDEMIVKALEMDCLCVVYGDCESCPFFDKDCRILPKAIKDLIHRLQGEIAEYERKLEDGELVSGEYHDEQMSILHSEIEQFEENEKAYKAEIERLTEEIKSIKEITSEQVVESEKLKQSCAEAVNSFIRLETLYKVKCKELEIANKKLEELKGGKID